MYFFPKCKPLYDYLDHAAGKKIQRDEFSKTSARHLGIPWPSASAAPNPLFGRAAAQELTARELVLAWEDTLTISRAADVCETLLAASLALNGQRPRSFSGFLLAPWLHGGLAGCFVCSDSSVLLISVCYVLLCLFC